MSIDDQIYGTPEPEQVEMEFDSLVEIATRGLRRVARVSNDSGNYILKGLRSEYADDFDYLDLVNAEYSRLAEINSPYVATPVGLMADSPIGPCLVVEDMRGMNMKQYMSQRRGESTRVKIAKDVLKMLADMHESEVYHGNLRPSNIYLSDINNQPWVSNLALKDCEVYEIFTKNKEIDTYTPPEYAAGLQLTPEADVYSLGRILEFLGLGDKFPHVIKRATAANPADRYHNAGEMLAAMKRRLNVPRVVMMTVIAILAVAAILLISLVALRTPESSHNSALQHQLEQRK